MSFEVKLTESKTKKKKTNLFSIVGRFHCFPRTLKKGKLNIKTYSTKQKKLKDPNIHTRHFWKGRDGKILNLI